MSARMNAWRISRHGGNEVLEWKDIDAPVAGPDQALVKITAIGLNHLDVWVRKGVEGHRFPLPITPGCDAVGITESFGTSNRVLINPLLSCGKCAACSSGQDALCKDFGIIGETRDGTCADRVLAPARNLIPIPDSVSDAEAAALGIPYVTAWNMLMTKAQIKAGDWILIHAGGSGVSVAAIQIAKLAGAHVITTVSTDDKAGKAHALGADHVINYKATQFRDEVKKIMKPLGKRGVDVAVDHVGRDTFSDSLKSLDWGGKLVTCGATSGSDIQIDLKLIFFKSLSILGSTMGSHDDLAKLLKLVEQKKIKPVIDSQMKLSKLPAALEKIEKRQAFGKIILTPG